MPTLHRIRGVRNVSEANVYRFVTEHWPMCRTARCVLVDTDFSIIKGL